jgi:hypothetical protein
LHVVRAKVDWRDEFYPDEDDVEEILGSYSSLTKDEIEDRIDEAAAMMAVIQDLRAATQEEDTTQPQGSLPGHRRFNPSVEIWKRIRLIPPWARHQLLADLEQGSIQNLWKSAMSRYVLDDERAMNLAQGYSIFDDFPSTVDSVVEYMGVSEKAEVGLPAVRFFAEEDKRKGRAEKKDKEGSREDEVGSWLSEPPRSFRLSFFVHPATGDIVGRFILPLLGPIEKWWEPPYYLRVKLDLTLTPIPQRDAGADFTFEFPSLTSEDLNGWLIREGEEGQERARLFLESSHLPNDSWPDPKRQMEEVANGKGCSPLSHSPRDYLRAAGPGVYVGCAYPSRDDGATYNEEDCVYFCIIRKWESGEA